MLDGSGYVSLPAGPVGPICPVAPVPPVAPRDPLAGEAKHSEGPVEAVPEYVKVFDDDPDLTTQYPLPGFVGRNT